MASEQFTGLLKNTEELDLSVTGRSSGKRTIRPVWFVLEDGKLYLLPVHGSDTNWYKNILNDPVIILAVNSSKLTAQTKPITDNKKVRDIVTKFRAKYGDHNVKKYYAKFDVAIEVEPKSESGTDGDIEARWRAPAEK